MPAGMMAGSASYFNPLPPCGGRRGQRVASRKTLHFNPLPPCGGRRDHPATIWRRGVFQSTPSVWRETRMAPAIRHHALFQSTPSVWRETNAACAVSPPAAFQSTPSVWRETIIVHCHHLPPRHFNPLPPCGGRPLDSRTDGVLIAISIHSLRVEGDVTCCDI